jgi:hypothetical protein
VSERRLAAFAFHTALSRRASAFPTQLVMTLTRTAGSPLILSDHLHRDSIVIATLFA